MTRKLPLIRHILICVLVVQFTAAQSEPKPKKHLAHTKYEVLHVNSECEDHRVQKGDLVKWNYVGWLTDGTEFDRGTFTATIGAGDVIEGVDIALQGMCEGDKRKMTIPPHEAYGSRGSGSGSIPPDSTIIFNVEMLEIRKPLKTTEIERTSDGDCEIRSAYGDTIHWKYHGTLLNGKIFDSGTYSATLGAGQVIVGVDNGMLDMCEGDWRRLTLPYHEAYGERGYPDSIPPYSTLIFDVVLNKIERPHNKEL